MAASIGSFARILPFPGERRSSIVANWPIQAERRLKYRYPLDSSLRFRSVHKGDPFSGTGVALNMSSGGILVATRHQVIEGALVMMSIEWPSLLDGKIPLQLIATGRVLRRGTSSFAATFERHEFRTMRSPSHLQA
jgi:hypothetical protein